MSDLTEALRTHGQQHRGTDLGGLLQWAALHIESQDEIIAMAREGWQLVPIIPTEAMQEAGQENGADSHFAAWEIYRAMLGSAPKP